MERADRELMANALSKASIHPIGCALLLCALTCGAGCGRGESNRPASGVAPISPSAAMGKGAEQPTGQSTSGEERQRSVPIGIVPTNPDVQTGVRLSFQGLPSGIAMKPKSIRWFVNGAEVSGEADRLPGSKFRKGNRVRATAEGEMNGEKILLVTPEVSVRNALPEIVSVSLSPMLPKTGETVRASAQGRDPDGDPLSFRYRWFVGGTEVAGQGGDTLVLKGIPRGAWIHAEAQAYDGEALGAKMFSPRIHVVNSPPFVERIDYTPSNGSTFEARIVVGDPDGDPISIRGKSIPDGVTLRGNVLSGSRSAVPGQGSLPVTVLVSDGQGGEFEYRFNFSLSVN